MVKRFIFMMLLAFLFAFTGCSDNPSVLTSGISNPTLQATLGDGNDKEDLEDNFEELEFEEVKKSAIEKFCENFPDDERCKENVFTRVPLFEVTSGRLLDECDVGHRSLKRQNAVPMDVTVINTGGAGACNISFGVFNGGVIQDFDTATPGGGVVVSAGIGDEMKIFCDRDGRICRGIWAVCW